MRTKDIFVGLVISLHGLLIGGFTYFISRSILTTIFLVMIDVYGLGMINSLDDIKKLMEINILENRCGIIPNKR